MLQTKHNVILVNSIKQITKQCVDKFDSSFTRSRSSSSSSQVHPPEAAMATATAAAAAAASMSQSGLESILCLCFLDSNPPMIQLACQSQQSASSNANENSATGSTNAPNYHQTGSLDTNKSLGKSTNTANYNYHPHK